jgi:hypothetical protein
LLPGNAYSLLARRHSRAGRSPALAPSVTKREMYAPPVPDPGELWKRWLMNDLRDLRNEMKGGNWLESESFRLAVVERFVFITAYVARKLFESEELTIDLIQRDWPITQYRCIRHPRFASNSASRATCIRGGSRSKITTTLSIHTPRL